jgi:hypothetical protein
MNLFLTGLIRNNPIKLIMTLFLIKKRFQNYNMKIFIIESDSTYFNRLIIYVLLTTFRKLYPKLDLKFKQYGHVRQKIKDRIQRLTYLRNEYLQYFYKGIRNYDYLVVLDFDGVVSTLPLKIGTILEDWPKNVAGIFGNQPAGYYDLYALRHDELMPGNFEELVSNSQLPQGLAQQLYMSSRFLRINEDLPDIEVDSAFGGFGIYNCDYLIGKPTYCCFNSNNLLFCEHVGFNQSILHNKPNLKFIIMPSLVTNMRRPKNIKITLKNLRVK